ncbi:MAG: methyltransferase domain-containing protein [Porphyrobacter sp.]|nr:methyltransferase domain-containing protein [Porphyrobacter sp.]
MDFQALSIAYTGAAATGYDARRAPSQKWLAEDSIVRELLRVLPVGASVLDVPVGTGRFLELYHERGLKVTGRDISPDMLNSAREKIAALNGLDGSLELADVRNIPDADGHYDCVLCIRFLNWVDAGGLEEVLRELRRVSKRYLIVSIRHNVPTHDLLRHGPNGFRRFAMRHLLGFRRWLRDLRKFRQPKAPRTNEHQKAVVLQTFDRLRLRIDSQQLVEHGRDGTDFYLYRLIKEEL